VTSWCWSYSGGASTGSETGGGDADDVVINASSVAELKAALDALPPNTAAHPYTLCSSAFNLSSNLTSDDTYNTLGTLYKALNRYVALDLRACTNPSYVSVSGTGKSFIVSVRLGKSLTTIRESAFNGCSALVWAELPGVTKIGESAFNGCSALESITLGSVPPTIGAGTFSNCPVFSAIYVPEGALANYQNTNASGWTPELKALVKVAK
jgi:hypothetical protein